MKFSVEKKDLTSRIHHLYNIVPSKNTMPILMNYLIEAFEESNTIRFTATDLEITVVVEFDLFVSEGGRVAVSARNFTDIINSLPDAMIHCEKVDDTLKIQCEKSSFDLLCADADQYPLIPQVDMENAKEINAQTFSKMIENTHFAVSTESNRPIFTGIFWQITPEHQLMVSTDGKKIAEFKVNQENDVPEVLEKIIPTKGLLFLKKAITDDDNVVHVLIEANRVMFKYGAYTIFTHILEGRFPDYTKAMPTDNKNELIVDKNLLHAAVKRVSLIASEETMKIRMEIEGNSLVISTTNREMGEAVESIPEFQYNGDPIKIAFNYRYLLMILSVIESDKVRVMMGNSQGAVLFFNTDTDSSYTARFLLMPLRIV